jgi:two-component system CheB/CheR fusion protein
MNAGSGQPAQRVVCVGSSAGGLEALTELLRSMTPDLPFAVVVGQHLSPTHDSPLAGLLARATTLPVRFASDGAVLEPGVVLVAPPDTDVTVGSDAVRVTEPGAGPGPHPNIDLLFRSAAAAWGERLVAVVLSGTGRDGSDGVVAVRTAGGASVAQLPDSARFADMPAAAVATGAVDLVLAPADIGPALSRLASAGQAGPGRGAVAVAQEEPGGEAGRPGAVEEITTAVGAVTGIDFGGYKQATLLRQIQRRMGLLQVRDLARYRDVVAADPREARALSSALLVTVTSFFRDATAWAALEEPLAALISSLGPIQQVRAWVPGCATGQEAYTIGMIISGLLGHPAALSHRMKIFATDLNEGALDVARRGQYPEELIQGLPQELRERWLRGRRQGWEIVPALRDCVVFARHNVALDPPFPRLHLICLRNTMIYFDPPLQERVLRLLHFALVPSGLLLLGESERVLDAHGLFEAVNAKDRLYRRRPASTAGVLPSPQARARPLSGAEPLTVTRHGPDERASLRDALIRRFAPPSLVLDADDEVIEVIGEVSRWCWVAEGQHSSHVVALLREELRPAVRGLLLRLRHGGSETVQRSVTTPTGAVLISVGRLDDDSTLARSVVSFHDSLGAPAAPRPTSEDAEASAGSEVERMAQELASTEAALQASIEELSASNEELQALNEELQASSEELQASSEEVQASNEELEATNEELSTLNAELQVRGDDLASANADLENIQASLTSGLILVDRELRVTRYSPLAVRVFALIESDLGRPLTAIPSTIETPGLEQRLRAAVEEQQPGMLELRGERSDVLLQFQPYRGPDGAVRGAIVVSTDVTELAEAHRTAQRSLRDLTAVTEALAEVVWQRGAQGRLLFLNSRVEEVFGLARDRVMADPGLLLATIHPDDRDRVALVRAAAPTQAYELEYRIVRPQGQVRWVLERAVSVRADETGPGYIVATALDVTDRHEVARQTHDRLATLEAMYDNSVFGVLILDESDHIVEANAFFATMSGYDQQTLVGMPIMVLAEDYAAPHPSTTDDEAGPAAPALTLGIAHRRLVSRNGTPYFVTMEAGPLALGGGTRRIVIVHDVTRLHEANEELSAQARFDPQTGLLVRSHFRALVSEQLARAARAGTGLAVLWIDLDGFKAINDRYGHRAGDTALREIAIRLQKTARQQDAVGRLGGDEFAMLVTDVDQEDSLESVTARVLAVLREPIVLDDAQVYVSGSIGVALAPEDGRDADVLMHHADTAMYSAKQAGRDRRVYFRSEMNRSAEARADTRHRLAAAVRAHQFLVHYQPILDTTTGAVRSVEALIRWDRDGEAVAAEEFLPLAEQTGHLPAIGRIALELIDHDLTAHGDDLGLDPRGAPLPICLNVSPVQLTDRHFVDWLLAWEPAGGFDRIVIEVTEAAALLRGGRAAETLTLLHRLGAHLSIDDFGTGYSNLALLDRLRPEFIKIDRSLLARAGHQSRGLAVLTAAVHLAHALDAEVVIEGVENDDLWQLTERLDVESAQGFHLAPPMALPDLLTWIRNRRVAGGDPVARA